MQAHDIITTKLTYTRDVHPIIAHRCIGCHGAADSIPLTSYQEVRPWAVGIKEQVLQRDMPPWGAVKGFAEFKNDRSLSQEEMLILSAWVVGGAPEGDAQYLKSQPVVSETGHELPKLNSVPVEANHTLTASLEIFGVKPIVPDSVDSARIVARKPDGETIPLVWLYRFKREYAGDFRYAEPITLPAGTVIESPVPLRLNLEIKGPRPAK